MKAFAAQRMIALSVVSAIKMLSGLLEKNIPSSAFILPVKLLLFLMKTISCMHPERYKKANLEANKGVERKDLYSESWAGDQYRGSSFNILTVIGALFILTPVAGLAFAYFSYGVLWG